MTIPFMSSDSNVEEKEKLALPEPTKEVAGDGKLLLPIVDDGVVFLDSRPLRPRGPSVYARIAFVCMFLTLVSTVIFVGMRCFVNRGVGNEDVDTGVVQAGFMAPVAPVAPMYTDVEQPQFVQPKQPVLASGMPTPRILEDAIQAAPKRTEVIPTANGNPSSASVSGAEQPVPTDVAKPEGRVWGFVRQSGMQIVNGRVVANWDRTIPLGSADDKQPNAQDLLAGAMSAFVPAEVSESPETEGDSGEEEGGRGPHGRGPCRRGRHGRGPHGGPHGPGPFGPGPRGPGPFGPDGPQDPCGPQGFNDDECRKRTASFMGKINDWMSQQLGQMRNLLGFSGN